jgi:hypothetical protein
MPSVRHSTCKYIEGHTRSSVFAALSLTNGRAMAGMRCEAETWPSWLLLRRSYGTDILACSEQDGEYERQATEEIWGSSTIEDAGAIHAWRGYGLLVSFSASQSCRGPSTADAKTFDDGPTTSPAKLQFLGDADEAPKVGVGRGRSFYLLYSWLAPT